MPAKPVIFIPGFPASELWRMSPRRMIFPPGLDDIATPRKRDRLIELLTTTGAGNQLEPGQPIRRVMVIAKQADSLYTILRQFGYTIESGENFRAIGWDWRLGIDDARVQADIRNAIATLTAATGQRPIVILHSTGGLVFRRLLETDATVRNGVDQILAFGVPWAGNLKAFRYLTKGQAMGFLTARLNASQVRTIMRAAQAAYDLCPPDPRRTVLTTPDGAEFAFVVDGRGDAIAPMLTPSWMPARDPEVLRRAAHADARMGERVPQLDTTVPITNVCGWGLMTETRCVIDGSSVEFEDTDQGDSTVAYVASSWIRGTNVRTLSLPIGVTVTDQIPDPHTQLWASEAVVQIFREVVDGVLPAPFVHAAADNDQSLDPNANVTIRITASTAAGTPLPNATATLKIGANNDQTFEINGTRHSIVLRRSSRTRANFGSRYFRFRVDVRWDGGAKELPLMIRV